MHKGRQRRGWNGWGAQVEQERGVCARGRQRGNGGETAASQHRGSLQEMVAELSLTDTPFRGDSSVEVLLACRAALVNHCHSRHVLSASQPVWVTALAVCQIRKRSFRPVSARHTSHVQVRRTRAHNRTPVVATIILKKKKSVIAAVQSHARAFCVLVRSYTRSQGDPSLRFIWEWNHIRSPLVSFYTHRPHSKN